RHGVQPVQPVRHRVTGSSSSSSSVSCFPATTGGLAPGDGTERREVMVTELESDAVVIGAGLAGLRAASCLERAGLTTVVLEARSRVGGRTCTEHLDDGGFVDHGGQWVSSGQPRVVALAAELGVELFPTWDDGLTVDWREGKRTTYRGLFPEAE